MPRLLTLALVLTAAAATRADPLPYRVAAARADFRAGKYADAEQTLAAVLKDAGAANAAIPADVYTLRLDNLAAWQRTDPKAVSADRLAAAYRQVFDDSAVKGKEVWHRAANNLGVRALADKRPGTAVEMFAALFKTGEVSGATAYLYRANYARALELAGRPAEAVLEYLASLRGRPAYERAADGLVRALAAVPAGKERVASARAALGIPNLPVLTRGMIATGLLAAWADSPDADAVRPDLLKYFAALPVTTARFADVEKPRLDAVAKKSERQKPWLDGLSQLYLDPAAFPIGKENWRIAWRTGLPAWKTTELPAAELAAVFKLAGDGFRAAAAARRDPAAAEAAFRRYALAVDADDRAFDGYRGGFAVLTEYREVIDPKRARYVDLVNSLFHEKSVLYYGAATRADYVSLQNMHVLLAAVYDATPDVEQTGARTAAFQWRMALRAERAIRGEEETESGFRIGRRPTDPDRTYPQSPEIRFRLAEALRREKRPDQAVRYYRQAVELAIDQKSPKQAQAYLDAINRLTPKDGLTIPADDPGFSLLKDRLGKMQRE